MKKILISENQKVFGPFNEIEKNLDAYVADDGTTFSFAAVGAATIEEVSDDYVKPVPEPEIFPTKDDNKRIAAIKLTETDYTALSDVDLVNKDEFIAYRAALRKFISEPTAGEVQWPNKPKAEWK